MICYSTVTQVATYALEMYVPASYTGTTDVGKLSTLFLAYIPSDQVDTLAQQIRAEQSQFYTRLAPPYSTLAHHVVASFPVDAASASGAPGSSPVDSSNGNSSADTESTSSSSKTREDAIIGVVSSLGAITLLVLAFLVVRAVKQRRELAHRRLSDQSAADQYVGARPENQDFDRDSVGGARRRSFYYAEDSLRGFEGARPAGDADVSAMRERRPVNANMISTPVLRDNTMAW